MVLMFSSQGNAGDEITGKVVGISDGDTITVLQNKTQYKIRLFGVDTPESHQDFGTRAKQFTSDMAFKKEVRVIPETTDRYGRTVGTVLIGTVCLNEELVRSGFAWVYRQYCTKPECQNWLKLETEAKNGKKGLWAGKDPIPPWDFRKGVTSGQSGSDSTDSGQSVTPNSGQTDSGQSVQSGSYIGNTKSRVFHRSGCRYFGCKDCTASFGSKDEAIKSGYRPCGICKP